MSIIDDGGALWLLHDAIAEHAAAHPARPALVAGTGILTYGELLENARSVAGQLRAAGVGRETPVAFCLPRGLSLGPAVLGTWLAGGACVPLDPEGPPQRRDYMLRDSSAAAIIATAGTAPAVRGSTAPVIVVDEEGAAAGTGRRAGTQPAAVSPGDLAYVIYTSGSTGRPKGVLVEQGNLAAMARSHESALYGGQGHSICHAALNNVAIADSFFSDFAHLGFGRTLHVVDDATRRDPDRLAQLLGAHGIGVLDASPTQIQAAVLAGHASALASLAVLVLGGEPTSPELWRQLSGLPGVVPYNLYGPTECTVAVTATAFRDHPAPMLGSPLPGCSLWVVDDALREVPAGETGELLVTGSQVARGYLNPAAADAARFVSFQLPGQGRPVRAYRTGDRGRRDQAGQLEFLGRTDSQVSIAGHRVEIGEVETVLRGCAGVRAAAVGTCDRRHETALAAFAVLDPGTAIEDIRAQLAAALPRHMIPVITVVPAIPMGPTGKADFTALGQATAEAGEEPPAMAGHDPGADTDLAGIVRRIWRQVLGIAAVDSGDDFFALGGDSVGATKAIVAIREALAPDLPIRVLFDNPAFGEFCSAVRAYAEAAPGVSGGPA